MKNIGIPSVLLALSLMMACGDPNELTPPTENVGYVPFTKGSWWVYKFTSNDNVVSYDTIRVLDQDTTFNGHTFTRLSNDFPFLSLANTILRVDSLDYYMPTPPEVSTTPYEFVALHTEQLPDTLLNWVVYSYSWGINGSFTGYLQKYCKQNEFLSSMTVGANTFDDVIHFECTQNTTNPFSAALDHGYFAKDIGLIQCVRSSTHSSSGTFELTDYFIAPE